MSFLKLIYFIIVSKCLICHHVHHYGGEAFFI